MFSKNIISTTFNNLKSTNLLFSYNSLFCNGFSNTCTGVVIGVFKDGTLTENGQKLNEENGGKITAQYALAKKKGKVGDVTTLFGFDTVPRVSIVGLGDKTEVTHNDVRKAFAIGTSSLKANGASGEILIDNFQFTQAASEGSFLSLYKVEKLGKKKEDEEDEEIFPKPLNSNEESITQFNSGKIFSDAQIFARKLGELPANYMTPTIFVEKVKEQFKSLENIEIKVRDKKWAEERNMGCFLAVSQGATEPLKFLEIHYTPKGTENDQPIIYVGKGVTFDTGGISLKGSSKMGEMKGDMMGAATTVSALWGISSLKINKRVIVLTPLCENVPDANSVKPGDVATASNGKTVEIDNTDAEGRLILADALVYAETFKPKTIIDVATLTGAISVSLGDQACGAFTNSDKLWKCIEKSGINTGERFWRMPLFPEYIKQMESRVADLNNTGSKGAGSSTAAAFLGEFVETKEWAHLDIAGLMMSGKKEAYIPKGITGVPTRALIDFVANTHDF